MYKCTECDYSTTKIGNFKRHKSVHQKALFCSFKCSLCNFKSNSKQNVTRHLGDKHIGQGNVLMDQEEMAASESDIKLEPLPDPHSDADPQENIVFEESFQCSACDYRSPRKQNVIRHQSLKHNAEEEAPDEPEDIKPSKSKPDLHPEIMYSPSFQCSLCPYWSTKKQNVVRHLSTKHDGNGAVVTQTKTNPDPPHGTKPKTDKGPSNKIIFEEMFQCSVCTYKSTNKQTVIKHQNIKHGSIDDTATETELKYTPKPPVPEISFLENFQCSLCNYRSNKKQNIKRHLAQKHNSKGVIITGSEHKAVFNPYQEIMFVANFPCNQCTYSSTKKQNLIRHQSLIHGVKKDVKKKPKLYSDADSDSYTLKVTESLKEQERDEEDESVPAKRLLLAECGLIWNSTEFIKKEEPDS